MLEWTQGGGGARLMMLVHHDDAVREYAYGADSKIGTFSDALMAEAKAKRLDRHQHEERLEDGSSRSSRRKGSLQQGASRPPRKDERDA